MRRVYEATNELDKLAGAMASHGPETLADLARRLAAVGPDKTMTTPKRIRILFNGAIVADTLGTSGALYVWEHDRYPQYYLPMEAFVKPAGFDVDLVPGDGITDEERRVVIAGFLKLSVKRNGTPDSAYRMLTEMVLFAADLKGPGKVLRNMVKVRFDAVGQWLEEETPIYVHPKDPFKRVDILSTSSRSIRVSVAGKKVAESSMSMHLYETTLPCRYYIPLTSVDTSVLRPSMTKTQCPYKGDAGYHTVSIDGTEFKDICWYYTHPTLECAPIAGLLCFYHEHDKVTLEMQGKQGAWEVISKPS